MEEIMKKIEYNNVINERLFTLESEADIIKEETEKRVKTLLSKAFHIDCPNDIDPQVMDELFKKWQKYKKDIVEDIRRSKYLERNKLGFPYIR